ncbi:MAG: class I SAM-dependent methyltransferase [Verrucomicrobia bacterium]|nr:class I SAM-dependent methyltransferase [Verrucomicrobiota bacterium]
MAKSDFSGGVPAGEFASMYAEGIPPWQIDRPQAEVLRLIDQGAFVSPVMDIGCGSGDNAIALARSGYRVVGVDAVEEALRRARAKVAREKLAQPPEFVLGDALRLEDSGLEVETILDCALFHTFSDEEQAVYVRGLAEVLAPGGRLHLLCFSELETRPPGPRRLSLAQITGAFGSGWEVVESVRCRYEDRVRPDGAHAWRVTMKKKSS